MRLLSIDDVVDEIWGDWLMIWCVCDCIFIFVVDDWYKISWVSVLCFKNIFNL
jgi:hypothetical protein